MTDKPWIDQYEPREWTVYQIPLHDKDAEPNLRETSEQFVIYGAESTAAAESYDRHVRLGTPRPNFFFYDFEQIAADRDKVYGCKLMELAEPWRGHPSGALVLITYEGIDCSPQLLTYLVAAA